jgi:hypothetical protein
VAWLLVMTALVAPMADVVVFGIHEHVSVAAQEQGSLSATGTDLAPSHHCELAMSPGVLLHAGDLPAPGVVASPPHIPAPPLASHTPLVPFGPPRA